jgi:CRISPR system Cascade subunit CasE
MEQATFPYPGPPDPEAIHRWVEVLMDGRADHHYVYAVEEASKTHVAITVRADKLPASLRAAARPVPVGKVGDVFDFTVTATAEKKDGRGPRKPLPPGDIKAREDWFARRGKRQGFEIVELTVRLLAPLKIRKREEGRAFALDRTRFSGRLRVTDPEKFTMALRVGVGRGRAYGNGLLFIDPI